MKVNMVIIPGINDSHAGAVAARVSELGADIMNCIPLYHVAGTPFETLIPPSPERMKTVRGEAEAFMPQMGHCSRCRADAAGLIGKPHTKEMTELLRKAAAPRLTEDRPYVAVASMEGLLVNQHLGEAAALWIYGAREEKAYLKERRPTPPSGTGARRWALLADSLSDCNTVLVSGIGPHPQLVLEKTGIRVVVMEGLAAEGVEAILGNRDIPTILLRTPGRCGIGRQCEGGGTGCG